MNSTDFPNRLIPLRDGRPGLRAALQITACSPPSPPSCGEEGSVPNSNCIPHSELRTPNSDGSQPILDFISSDNSLDRYDEIICPEGWHLDAYRRNPVFQNSHQYGDIIFTLGKALITEVRLIEGRPVLFQRIAFATEVNPMARIAYGLYNHGFLHAVSVGFIPLRWENPDGTQYSARSTPPLPPDSGPPRPDSSSPRPDSSSPRPDSGSPRPIRWGEGSGVRGSSHSTLCTPNSALSSGVRGPSHSELRTPTCRRKHLEQELLEVSAVAIPANPNALALGLKSGAIDKSDVRELAELCSRSLQAAPSCSQLSTLNSQLISLARQVRDLMKRA